jgi:anthranilate phosphoribosyltransferase
MAVSCLLHEESPDMIESELGKITAGESLSMAEMQRVIDHVMQGSVPEPQIALFLTALKEKGETVEELAGAAAAMRQHMTPIRHHRSGVIDTCGPGGHGSGTFNISTAAAIVAAAAGVPVAKHGNRSITSNTGSADVLAALGVNIAAEVPVVEACLNEIGVCFCFAPSLHSAMKHVAAVRRSLPFRTIFNLLGPLCNPAGAPYQLLGVGKPELRPLLAQAMALLRTERTIVAFGEDGIGEVSLAGPTQVTEVTWQGLREFVWQPSDFGLSPSDRSTMLVETPAESAAIIRGILSGERGPPRDIVVLNAAAALWTAGRNNNPQQCARLAAEAIDSGAARTTLERLVALSH